MNTTEEQVTQAAEESINLIMKFFSTSSEERSSAVINENVKCKVIEKTCQRLQKKMDFPVWSIKKVITNKFNYSNNLKIIKYFM